MELKYPSGGIDLSRGFADQQPRQIGDNFYARTCRDAQNVRGYDTLEERRRGGSRPGLTRVFPEPVVSGWIVQHLNVIVTTDSTAVV